MNIPRKNELHTVTITDADASGFGIGRTGDGFALFTAGALPGDELLVRILKVKQRYAYAKTEQILTPSPYRKTDTSAICPFFPRCGGCQWQHCEYGAQLVFKKRMVIDALTRIGGITNPPVEDTIGMEHPYRYRNKAVFPVGIEGIGVYAPRSHRIVPVTHCNIQHPVTLPVLETVQAYMKRSTVPAYDETTHTGLMRQVMVRTGASPEEVMVVCVVNGAALPHEKALAGQLTRAGAATVLLNAHTAKGNTVLGDRFRILSGGGTIRQQIGHIAYQVTARSFFQVNTAQAEILYEKAVALGNFNGSEIIADAHAGAGGVALYAANRVKQVYGSEIIPEAVADAKKNAALNGISNVLFQCAPAEEAIADLLRNHPIDAVFLDPPRKGCGEKLLEAVASAGIKKIIYISCEPATLARDIAYLLAQNPRTGGYALTLAQPVDMFPQTGKVETVCLLEKI
jgi:23S rRNA (uracil1939-C5)-methyltransferase